MFNSTIVAAGLLISAAILMSTVCLAANADRPLVDFEDKPAIAPSGGARAEAVGNSLRVTFGSERGSAITIRSPRRGWDLSDRVSVRMDVRNSGQKRVALRAMLNNVKCTDGFVALEPGAADVLDIIIKRKVCTDARSKYFEAMNGWPGGFLKHWSVVDPSKAMRISIAALDGTGGERIEISNVRSCGEYASPPESELKGSFFPFVDRYGQYMHADWPGKIRTDSDLATTRRAEDRDIALNPSAPGRNQYGGWATGPRLKATGHFRTQKHEGKWWLVDPEGRLFWSHGVTGVRMIQQTRVKGRERYFSPVPDEFRRGSQYDFAALNLSRKLGRNWKELAYGRAHARLRSWGMNTIANWSEEAVFMQRKTPYVVAIHYKCPQIGTKFPDVNRPEFRKGLRGTLEYHRSRTANDPWCIGYFIDNELRFPGKNRAALLEKYYKACREEMKRVAPNKLYLGSRLHGHDKPYGGQTEAVRASAKYCDVLGVNRYRFSPSDLKMLDGVDIPIIIGEFHWGALDRGMLHTGLRSVANQKQRGEAYIHYVTQALKHPHIVGTHWFQYQSQVVTGRGDGENYQIGFVDICDTPYVETVRACRKVGYDMYRIRAGD